MSESILPVIFLGISIGVVLIGVVLIGAWILLVLTLLSKPTKEEKAYKGKYEYKGANHIVIDGTRYWQTGVRHKGKERGVKEWSKSYSSTKPKK